MSVDTELGENNCENLQQPAHVVKSSQAYEVRTVLAQVNKANDSMNSSPWEHIRQLDECENWTERTQVVTRTDHQFYLSCAKDFLTEIINGLPEQSSQAELIDDNFIDEDFQTTANQLDMDYLERLNPTYSDEAVALSRQSLYVKFDPLVGEGHTAKPSPASRAKQLEEVNANYASTTGSSDLLQLDTPSRSTSGGKSQRRMVHFSSSPSGQVRRDLMHKDLLTSTPDRNSGKDLNNYDSAAPPTSLPQQQLPAMTVAQVTTNELVKVLKYSDDDMTAMRAQIQLEAAEREQQMKEQLEMEHSHQIALLKKENSQLSNENDCIQAEVMLQFADKACWDFEVEKWKNLANQFESDNNLVLEKHEKMKAHVEEAEKHRDQALMDFESLEKSFNEMHQRYLKLKSVAQAMKKNEDNYQKIITELEQTVAYYKEDMKNLKADVDAKLSEANQMFHQMKKEHASEMAILKANCKKLTLQNDGLAKTIKQKEQEKNELTAICEELMKELGDKQ